MESPLVSFRGEGWKILPGWVGYANHDPEGVQENGPEFRQAAGRAHGVRTAQMFCAYGDIFTLGEVYCCDYGPKGHRGRAESPPALRCAAILLQEKPLPGPDAPTTARAVGLPPRGG